MRISGRPTFCEGICKTPHIVEAHASLVENIAESNKHTFQAFYGPVLQEVSLEFTKNNFDLPNATRGKTVVLRCLFAVL
jgi:hypothetical protein